MVDLNVSNHATDASDINPKLNKLKTRLDELLPVWNRLNDKQRKRWVKSGISPILTAAWLIWKYLHRNFFGQYASRIEEVDNG